MEGVICMECPFCQEKFKAWKKDGLNISCKECHDFYESHIPFEMWKMERNLGEKNVCL